MLNFFRKSASVLVLRDEAAFWKHCERTRRLQHTPRGPAGEAEERLDLRAATAIKALLEAEVGPEEGPNPVQMQNWDWHDDRTRGVYLMRVLFRPELIPRLQALLVGEFADFRIIVALLDDWKSDAWGHLLLTSGQLAVQQNVARAYVLAN